MSRLPELDRHQRLQGVEQGRPLGAGERLHLFDRLALRCTSRREREQDCDEAGLCSDTHGPSPCRGRCTRHRQRRSRQQGCRAPQSITSDRDGAMEMVPGRHKPEARHGAARQGLRSAPCSLPAWSPRHAKASAIAGELSTRHTSVIPALHRDGGGRAKDTSDTFTRPPAPCRPGRRRSSPDGRPRTPCPPPRSRNSRSARSAAWRRCRGGRS